MYYARSLRNTAFAAAITTPLLLTHALSAADAQVPSITLNPVRVTERQLGLHEVESESERVGPANQPEWTTRRAFAETDIYVIPSGEIEFNQFYISSHPKHGKPEHFLESEFEIGLPWRTQFDVELNSSIRSGRFTYDSTAIELPHALADWGRIPLNPTIDAGWKFKTDESDSYFFRILLAEEISRRFHFGANLTFQSQVGGEHEKAYELNAALSYVVVDSKLTAGVEMLAEYETAGEEDDAVHSTSVMVGASLLYKPSRNTHLGFVPLFGITRDAPAVEAFLIFGIDFEAFRWSPSGRTGPEPSQLIHRRR